MTTAAERARAAFDELERRGVQPLDDTGWMNPEDKDAICHPFVAAILAAERDAAARAREAMLNEAWALAWQESRRARERGSDAGGIACENVADAIRALKSQPPKGGQ